GPRVEERDLALAATVVRHCLRQTMVKLVGNHGVVRMDKLEDLLPYGLDHPRVRVANGKAAEPTGQVEVTVAIDVLDDRPIAAGDDDGLGIRGNGPGHPGRSGRRQRARAGAGNVARDPDGTHRSNLRWWSPGRPGALRGALGLTRRLEGRLGAHDCRLAPTSWNNRGCERPGPRATRPLVPPAADGAPRHRRVLRGLRDG